MDTTREYLEMCEKAEEIQKGWNPKEHDYVQEANSKYLKVSTICNGCIAEGISLHNFFDYDDYKGECIWLPRQDQLQEIYSKDIFEEDELNACSNTGHFILDLFRCAILGCDKPCDITDWTFNMHSLEQLWLAFVMNKVYGKKWNSEDWISEDDQNQNEAP